MSFEEGKENPTDPPELAVMKRFWEKNGIEEKDGSVAFPPWTKETLWYLKDTVFPDVYPETSERTVTRNYPEDVALEILFSGSLVRNYPNRGPNEDGTEGS